MTEGSGSVGRMGSLLRLIAVGGGRGSRAARGSIAGTAARLIVAVGSLITIPLLLGYLGAEQYGLWVAVATTMAWVALMQLGVQPSLLNRLAGTALDDVERRTTLVATAWWTSVALCLAGIGVLLVLDALDVWGALFNAHGALAETARKFALVMWLGVAVSMPLLVPQIVLRADQEVHKANLIEVVVTVARVVAVVVAVTMDMSLLWLVLSVVFLPVIVSALGSIWIFRARAIWPKPSAYSRRLARLLLTTGMGFLGIMIATLLITSTDALVITQLFGPAAVPTYSVAFALLVIMMGIQFAVADALWPAYAEASSAHDLAWIRRIHRQATMALVAGSAVFGVTLVLLGQPLIGMWAGPEAVPPVGLLVVFGLIAVFAAVEVTHNRLMVAMGRVRRVTMIVLTGAVLNVPVSVLLGMSFGVTGVAAGTLVAYVVTSALLVRSSRGALRSESLGGER